MSTSVILFIIIKKYFLYNSVKTIAKIKKTTNLLKT